MPHQTPWYAPWKAMICERPVWRRANLMAVSTASEPAWKNDVWQLPRSPSGMTLETLLASSIRLGLVMSVVCMMVPLCRRMAASTLGWPRPTAFTATPAAMSMNRLPSASMAVEPLPCSRMTGKSAPPRVKASYLADSSIRARTFGPGTEVTILGASGKESSFSSASEIIASSFHARLGRRSVQAPTRS